MGGGGSAQCWRKGVNMIKSETLKTLIEISKENKKETMK